MLLCNIRVLISVLPPTSIKSYVFWPALRRLSTSFTKILASAELFLSDIRSCNVFSSLSILIESSELPYFSEICWEFIGVEVASWSNDCKQNKSYVKYTRYCKWYFITNGGGENNICEAKAVSANPFSLGRDRSSRIITALFLFSFSTALLVAWKSWQ